MIMTPQNDGRRPDIDGAQQARIKDSHLNLAAAVFDPWLDESAEVVISKLEKQQLGMSDELNAEWMEQVRRLTQRLSQRDTRAVISEFLSDPHARSKVISTTLAYFRNFCILGCAEEVDDEKNYVALCLNERMFRLSNDEKDRFMELWARLDDSLGVEWPSLDSTSVLLIGKMCLLALPTAANALPEQFSMKIEQGEVRIYYHSKSDF